MKIPRACKGTTLATAYTIVAGQFGNQTTVFSFDGKSVTVTGTVDMPKNPSWIEPAGPKSNGAFYTLSDDNILLSMKLDGKGSAAVTGQVHIPGEAPVHIKYAGDFLAVANFGTLEVAGSAAYVALGADGLLSNSTAVKGFKLPYAYTANGTAPNPQQSMSRSHCSAQTADGMVWTTDYGSDSVWTWTLESGNPTLNDEYKVPKGFAPRHLATPDGKNMYVVGEISNAVVALQKGKVAENPVSILPPGLPEGYGKLMGAGELVAHPTHPTTLYASNRNQLAIVKTHADYMPPQGDAVAILSVETPGAPAKVLTHIVTKCDHIRGMKVSPDGNYVAVAGLNNKKLEIYKISGQNKEVWTLVASHDGVDQITDVTFFPKA